MASQYFSEVSGPSRRSILPRVSLPGNGSRRPEVTQDGVVVAVSRIQCRVHLLLSWRFSDESCIKSNRARLGLDSGESIRTSNWLDDWLNAVVEPVGVGPLVAEQTLLKHCYSLQFEKQHDGLYLYSGRIQPTTTSLQRIVGVSSEKVSK